MRDKRHGLKWLLGLVIIILVLSVTFDDVYGLNIPPGNVNGNGSLNNSSPDWYSYSQNTCQSPDDYQAYDSQEPSTPPEIPEPSTLILLASGLGVIRLVRRRKA